MVLGSVRGFDAASFLPLAALKGVSVMQRYDTTTIVVNVWTTTKKKLEARTGGPTALEQVIQALNDSGMTDLEIAHEVVTAGHFWDTKYLAHAVLHRLDSPTLRRLGVGGTYRQMGAFLRSPRAARIQHLVATGNDVWGILHYRMNNAAVAMCNSRRVVSICINPRRARASVPAGPSSQPSTYQPAASPPS